MDNTVEIRLFALLKVVWQQYRPAGEVGKFITLLCIISCGCNLPKKSQN